jgi:UDP-N-acetylmuramoyl-L-alanyl-D-glutamate--2,6-diaminopimelate ligase
VLNADSDAFPAFASAAVTSGQTILSVGHEGQGLRWSRAPRRRKASA